MTFSKSFLGSLLLAGVGIASPISHQSPRGAPPYGLRGSRPANSTVFLDSHASHSNPGVATADSVNTLSFNNWAGAILESSGVTSVVGTFTIPQPQLPSGADSSTSYCGCAWLGIDGDSDVCPNGGLLQAGTAWCIQGNTPSFYAWYEWWPAQEMITFDNFDVTAGDEITVTITATSTSTGYALLENVSQGTSVRHTWKTESPSLCEATGEWIVEDFSDISSDGSTSLAPFANYGQVTFTGNSATVNRQTVGISQAQPVNMVQNGYTISQSTISNGKVVVTYEG
ncbi:putative aspergillopepsin-2 precursor [Talaromyces proteolyticus]|uniref:Aspergillopepsin-2 n=1 Tax=Talaromyces proteolyticus TaxID=1131652 RepID=A0AAD4Q3X1_9EURO|nr:putative aspergillopepsin-2 precursor [Talaromyces proteolyticus]KAH8705534.1 putative aspergillopepsin-2 precursor [Talaromyces proteolyticus]